MKLPHVRIRKVVTGINYTLFISDIGNVYSVGCNNHYCLGTNDEAEACSQIKQITSWKYGDFTKIRIIDASASNCYTVLIDEDYNLYGCGCAVGFNYSLINSKCGRIIKLKPKLELLPEEKIIKVQCDMRFILYLTNFGRLFLNNSDENPTKLIASDVSELFREPSYRVMYKAGSSWYHIHMSGEVRDNLDPADHLIMSHKDPSRFESYQGLSGVAIDAIPQLVKDCTFQAFSSTCGKYILCSK